MIFNSSLPVAATVAISSVPGSVTTVVLLAANPLRKHIIIVNEQPVTGGSNMHIALAATATLTTYSVLLTPGQVYESTLPVYTGVISAIWDSASGNARVTEVT
jgi:hypothetical protein